MASNTITLTFSACEPAPANGYLVKYRILGSFVAYRTAGPFPTSPIQFVDNEDPIGTSYEGYIQGSCGPDNLGVPIPWEAVNGASAGESEPGSGGDSGSEPEVQCRQYTMTKTVGSPSAHYIDCGGVTRDTTINDHTVICTNGHGFTISGGGIVVNSFVDGDC